MPSFTDSTGRRWTVRVSLGSLRELEEAVGFPVLAAIADRERLRREILGRAEVLAKALYFAIGEESQRRDVAFADFELRVSGPAVGEAARAFFDALVESFPPAPPAGEPAKLESWEEWRMRAGGKLPERLDEPEIRERWAKWAKNAK